MPSSILDRGYRVTGLVVNLAAALVANAATIYRVSNFGQQIGTKSFIPRKLLVRNNAAGACWLSLGTGVGAAFAATLPAVRVLNNLDNPWEEVSLPTVEHFADMTAWMDVLIAGGSLDIQIEVEEIG